MLKHKIKTVNMVTLNFLNICIYSIIIAKTYCYHDQSCQHGCKLFSKKEKKRKLWCLLLIMKNFVKY